MPPPPARTAQLSYHAGDVGDVHVLDAGEGVGRVRRCYAVDGSLQAVEALLLNGGEDFRPESSREGSLVQHSDASGLGHRRSERSGVQRHQRSEVQDFDTDPARCEFLGGALRGAHRGRPSDERDVVAFPHNSCLAERDP